MKYCRNCLQPDTRPNTFFEKGICPACKYSLNLLSEQKNSLVFDNRVYKFKEYIKPYLNNNSQYNCIVGVSGGKDSTSQALFARDVLGLNPILVCLLFPPDLVSRIGAINLANLSKLGFNVHVMQLGARDWKKMMRCGLEKYGNPLVSTEQALYCSVPEFAIRHSMKLILWGENPALQLGDMNQLGDDAFDGDKLRKANTIRDGNVDWCKEIWNQIPSINRYRYPTEENYKKYGIKTSYMGPAMYDWSMINNIRRSSVNGFKTRNEKPDNIGDNWGAMALDQNITVVNQRIKYLKFGFGRMTDFVNDQIRYGLINREEAISMVEKYDGKCTKRYFKRLARYLEISYETMWNIIDSYVNYKLFDRVDIDEYKPKYKVGVGL